MEVDMDANGRIKGDQLRIKVVIDVTKPLRHRLMLRMHGEMEP